MEEMLTRWLIETGTGEIAQMSADTAYSDARRMAQELADELGETTYLVEKTTTGKCYSSGVFEPRLGEDA